MELNKITIELRLLVVLLNISFLIQFRRRTLRSVDGVCTSIYINGEYAYHPGLYKYYHLLAAFVNTQMKCFLSKTLDKVIFAWS